MESDGALGAESGPGGLIYAGLDEAGYGPLLGPLCVGMAVFRTPLPSPEAGAPDLWRRLSAAVCRKPGDGRRRIAIDDSKRLKLPNDVQGRDPLCHLERGVICLLAASGGAIPRTDEAMFAALRARFEAHAWYGGVEAAALPRGEDAAALAIAANRLRSCLEAAGVEALGLRCAAVGESAFNDGCVSLGSKAAVNFRAAGGLLRSLWLRFVACEPPARPEPVLAALDRHGGRTRYGEMLAEALHGSEVVAAEESSGACRYTLRAASGATMRVEVCPEGESRHLPVAAASMTAKYVRELAMARFNRHFAARMPELKPTAGYREDARRWLRDAAGVLSEAEVRAMVRRA